MLRLILFAGLILAAVLVLVPQWRPAAMRHARSLLWLGAALLYLRSPVDLLPDGLGPLGFLDDLLVLALAIWTMRNGGAPEWLRRAPSGRTGRSEERETVNDPGRSSNDPYVVLGIDRGASAEEITHAYRQQMKRYHPDRVEGLGDELREVAHRKTREIQQAYDTLRGKR